MKIRSWLDMDHSPREFVDEDPPEGYTGEPVMSVSEIIKRISMGMPVQGRYPSDDPQLFESELVDDFDYMDYRDSLVGEAKPRARQEAASGSPGERPTQSQPVVEDFKESPAESPGSEIS